MADTKELLGALLRRGLTDSSPERIEHSLGEDGIGGFLEREFGVASVKETAAARSDNMNPSSNPLDAFRNIGNIAKSFLGEGEQGKAIAAGGLGALMGAILGGGGKSAKGAIGGGALALLGMVALKALREAQQQKSPSKTAEPEIDASTKLMAGLREPENKKEEKEVQTVVDLTIRAMVNAAKADGQIDEDEMQKVVGELQEDGISQTERDYLLEEVRKPMCTNEIVSAVPNRQVAAQVYAASLLAIEADTPAEKAYLKQLARDLKLDAGVVAQLHSALGVAVA